MHPVDPMILRSKSAGGSCWRRWLWPLVLVSVLVRWVSGDVSPAAAEGKAPGAAPVAAVPAGTPAADPAAAPPAGAAEPGGAQLGGGAPDGVIPVAHSAARYREMVENSPFAVATPVVASAEPEPNFAMNLYVVGVLKMRYPDGRQSDYVTIKSRADNTTFSLQGSQPNKDGIALVGVEWAEVGKSKVNLKKGAEFGTLEFDEANIRGGGVGGAANPAVSVVAAGGAGVPPPFPGGAGQRPAARPGAVPLGQPLNGGGRPATPVAGRTGSLATPAPSSVRRRIRPISSGQGTVKPQPAR